MKSTQRQQLKENPFAAATLRAVDAVTANRTRIAVIATIAAVVLVAVGGLVTIARQRTDRAGTLLGIAMATAQAQIAPASTLPGVGQASGTFPTEEVRLEATETAYREVIDEYPSTEAARAARFHLANEYVDAGRLDDAEQLFRDAAESGGQSVYAASAELGLAEVLSAKGSYDEAIAVLTAMAASREGLVPVDGVLMQLGKTNLAAGHQADAEAAFRRVVDEFPTSIYLADAEARLGTTAQ